VPTWAVLATIVATALALVPVANRTLRRAPDHITTAPVTT
jgi:hypothetical protein